MKISNLAKVLLGSVNQTESVFYEVFAASFAFYRYKECAKQILSMPEADFENDPQKLSLQVKEQILNGFKQLLSRLKFDEDEAARLKKRLVYVNRTLSDLERFKQKTVGYQLVKKCRIDKEKAALDEDICDEAVFNYLGCAYIHVADNDKTAFRKVVFEAVQKEAEALYAASVDGRNSVSKPITVKQGPVAVKCY